MAQPGTTKRVVTILWSVGIAVILVVITTAVILSSTKRAHISLEQRERMARDATLGLESTTAGSTTAPAVDDWRGFSGSKSMVLPLDRARVPSHDTETATTPQDEGSSFSSSKVGVLPLDRALERLKPATVPSSMPSR